MQFDRMKRREFITLLGGAAAAWPLAARAQKAMNRPARIGLLRASPTPDRSLDALRRGLVAKGYVEGQSFVFVPSFDEGDSARLPDLATALIASGVDLIVTEGDLATKAARAASATIPIIMATSPDPLQTGLIERLSRPGGNITGLSSQASEMTGKLMEIAKEIVGLARVAVIMSPSTWNLFGAETLAAARTLGLDVVHIDLDMADIDAGLRKAVAEKARAGVVRGRPFFSLAHMKATVERAAAHRLPLIYEARDFVELGGLMAFGVDVSDLYFRVATYVDKVLKGAKPADLPVEQPTKFELVVNMKTAKDLGLAI